MGIQGWISRDIGSGIQRWVSRDRCWDSYPEMDIQGMGILVHDNTGMGILVKVSRDGYPGRMYTGMGIQGWVLG